MGKCIEKIRHNTKSCGAFALQVFAKDGGGYDGYCFACGKYEPNPYQDKPAGYKPTAIIKTPEQILAEIEEVGGYQSLALPDRKLKKESLEYFGVKVSVSEEDGTTPMARYCPAYNSNDELIGYKVQLNAEKRMWAIGSTKGAVFFGWQQARNTGGKKLFITEGEMDAVALYQIFKDKNKGTPYADHNPAIVSLAHGAGGADKEILSMLPEIRKIFKEIVLVFDMDAVGKEAAEKVLKVCPDALVASLPAKDANQCLIDGRSKACYDACQFNASKPKNTRLINGADLHEKAKVPPVYGVSWPWKHLTKATRGIRLGETIYIGAGQKQGKSEVVNTLAAHFIKTVGWKVLLVKPEEANNKSYKLVAGKMVGKIFHDPEIEFDEEAYERAGLVIGHNLFLVNLYQHVGWETLKQDIREAALNDVKAVFIDPITNLTNGMSAADANVKLQEISQELAAMALDLNVVIFIFCHLRNPEAGPPHEKGGKVLSSQFAGSRAMARSCNLMIGLEGNRDPNLTREARNMRTLVLLEDREFGETGRYKLYWDHNTGLFNEIN